jgi:hypothetical protein
MLACSGGAEAQSGFEYTDCPWPPTHPDLGLTALVDVDAHIHRHPGRRQRVVGPRIDEREYLLTCAASTTLASAAGRMSVRPRGWSSACFSVTYGKHHLRSASATTQARALSQSDEFGFADVRRPDNGCVGDLPLMQRLHQCVRCVTHVDHLLAANRHPLSGTAPESLREIDRHRARHFNTGGANMEPSSQGMSLPVQTRVEGDMGQIVTYRQLSRVELATWRTPHYE